MAGFRKAKPMQAFLRLGMYGPAGSGKTFTSLLIGEGLAAAAKKRLAFVDTEHGTDFYAISTSRKAHPEAFDFDAIYTKSITEVVREVMALDPDEYGAIVIDSMTHLWESCIASYSGGETSAGTIPMHAWGKIKAPYKKLMNHLLNVRMHVVICGRQGMEYQKTDGGELSAVGTKMKAEGETAYEPAVLIRMEAVRAGKTSEAIPTAFAEKDRTGILSGRVIEWPTFDNIAAPVIKALGAEQGHIPSAEETRVIDVAALAEDDDRRRDFSREFLRRVSAKLELADTVEEVEAINAKLTPDIKAKMISADQATLRGSYHLALSRCEREDCFGIDLDAPPPPKHWKQKSPPKKARPGDTWEHPDTGEIQRLDGDTWIPEKPPEAEDDNRAALELDLENAVMERAAGGCTTVAAVLSNVWAVYGWRVNEMPTWLMAPLAAALRASQLPQEVELTRAQYLQLIMNRCEACRIELPANPLEMSDAEIGKLWGRVAEEASRVARSA